MKLLAHPATEKNIHAFLSAPSHGLLIIGSKGSGKSHVAKYIIAKILDKSEKDLENYPYLKNFSHSPEQDLGIDDIRELKKFLRLKTTGRSNLRRFAIINDADILGHAAQNAMLKLLEEPPADTCIILTVSEPNKLKPTILSRLQTIKVRHLPKSQLASLAEDRSQIDRLYALSEGAISIFLGLNNRGNEQKNSRYINDAKELAVSTRAERLIKIDKLAKDKEYDADMLLDGLYKIINMKFKIASASGETKATSALHKKMQQTLHAQKMLNQKAQPKLVLTKLFYEL